jgi:hypothetical protein
MSGWFSWVLPDTAELKHRPSKTPKSRTYLASTVRFPVCRFRPGAAKISSPCADDDLWPIHGVYRGDLALSEVLSCFPQSPKNAWPIFEMTSENPFDHAACEFWYQAA